MMKKKFTRGGGAPLVLTVIALIISLIAAFEEFIARAVYNAAFDTKTDKVFLSDIIGFFTMDRNSVSVIRIYTEKAFILALVAFISFIVLAASARKKKIVSGEAWMMMITSAACAIEPVIYMTYFFSNDIYKNFSDSNDGVRFRSFYGFLIYALPLLAAFLLCLAGFILLIRLAKEKAVYINDETAEITAESVTAADTETAYVPPMSDSIFRPQAEAVMPEAVLPVQTAPEAEAAPETSEENTSEPEEILQTVPAETAQEPEPVITYEAEKVFCGNCGQQLDPAAKFCNNCGAKR